VFPILEKPWQKILIDFIIRLLESQTFSNKKYDVVLIIVCRLIKYTLYIFITKQFIVEGFVILFLEYIFCPFGLLDDIVSNKDSLFINKF